MTQTTAAVTRLHRFRPARWAGRAALAALAVILAACSSPAALADDPDALQEVALTTDRDAYAMPDDGGALVRFTFRNQRPNVASLPACDGRVVAEVQREEGGAWAQYSSGICPANLEMSPVVVEPKASRDDGVWIGQPGRYRLRVEYGSPMLGVVHEALSPAFTVTR